jgi:NAD-dependent deacetylase
MSPDDLDAHADDIARTAEQLNAAGHVACLTGAGISAESGIPTFRGAEGLWSGRRATDLATPEAFARDPEEVWQFYLWRRGLLAEKKPNPGHFALAAIEKHVKRFTLITQNVDNLHLVAGSQNIIELHGNVWIDRCTSCRGELHRSIDDHADEIPYCKECGAMMRPGVVWFGEMLPPDAIAGAQTAAMDCDVMFVVGTSAVVQPAASLADWAKAHGAFLVEINPDATALSPSVDVRFPLPSGKVLPRIADALTERR